MKGVFWSLAIGCTVGCAIGYIFRKMQDEGKLDSLRDCADKYLAKSKEEIKNVVDAAKEKAEDFKGRFEKAVKG